MPLCSYDKFGPETPVCSVMTITGRAAGSGGSVHGENPINSLGDRCRTDIHFPMGIGGVMSKFERLLVAGSTELPDCRCAAEMNLIAIVPVPGGDTESRVFRCPECNHELRLTAWRTDLSAA